MPFAGNSKDFILAIDSHNSVQFYTTTEEVQLSNTFCYEYTGKKRKFCMSRGYKNETSQC